jgi:16S rRNA (uracil1498-N3)-methyltransferase
MPLPGHNLFYASRVGNGIAYLDSEESRHATSVLRLSRGDAIQVTDGKGSVFECRARESAKGELPCEIVSTKNVPRPQCPITLFVGIGDRDRFEELVENCAALGADEIIPLVCKFCQKPWWSAWEKHSQRIWKKLVAGIKQSRNPWLPLLIGPTVFEEALTQTGSPLIIAAEASGKKYLDILDRIKQASGVSCFVGPPGGFSPEELEGLKKAGAVFVSLSANRLRTELAAATLCSAVKMTLETGSSTEV